jgi:phosphate transport system permease protein
MRRPRSLFWRRAWDFLVKAVAALLALLGCFVLGWILLTVIERGGPALAKLSFFVNRTSGVIGDPDDGVGNAILGTLLITALAVLIGTPIGLLAGTFLSEYGRDTWLARVVSFCANVLFGVPSIIVGVFVYVLFGLLAEDLGLPLRRPSAYAGATALAILLVPVVTRTTADMLRLVPDSLREAALALGAPRWRITLLTWRAARSGILTGVLLGIARVSGETAPLLFTALNYAYWPTLSSLNGRTANLTVTIFDRAIQRPSEEGDPSAWGASLLITLGVLSFTIVARVLLRWRAR